MTDIIETRGQPGHAGAAPLARPGPPRPVHVRLHGRRPELAAEQHHRPGRPRPSRRRLRGHRRRASGHAGLQAPTTAACRGAAQPGRQQRTGLPARPADVWRSWRLPGQLQPALAERPMSGEELSLAFSDDDAASSAACARTGSPTGRPRHPGEIWVVTTAAGNCERLRTPWPWRGPFSIWPALADGRPRLRERCCAWVRPGRGPSRWTASGRPIPTTAAGSSCRGGRSGPARSTPAAAGRGLPARPRSASAAGVWRWASESALPAGLPLDALLHSGAELPPRSARRGARRLALPYADAPRHRPDRACTARSFAIPGLFGRRRPVVVGAGTWSSAACARTVPAALSLSPPIRKTTGTCSSCGRPSERVHGRGAQPARKLSALVVTTHNRPKPGRELPWR